MLSSSALTYVGMTPWMWLLLFTGKFVNVYLCFKKNDIWSGAHCSSQVKVIISVQWVTWLTGKLWDQVGEAARSHGLTPGEDATLATHAKVQKRDRELGNPWEPDYGILSSVSSTDFCDFNIWRVAFILGRSLNLSLQKGVEAEAAQFGDIVQVEQILDNWKSSSWMHLDNISQFGDIVLVPNFYSTSNRNIVQADFIDSYRNMSYKNLLGLAWLSSWCPQAR